MNLSSMFGVFESYDNIVPTNILKRLMEEVSVDEASFGHCLRFGDSSYCKNLLYAGSTFQALIICWRPGQRSPIHDHKGSACAVRVLMGTATETRYEKTKNGLRATGSSTVSENGVMTSEDLDIHEVSNEHAKNLVTLHVYSPPLLFMGVYSASDSFRNEEDCLTA
jgi:cysteine dioxygenase